MNFNFVGRTHENKLMDEIQSDSSWEHMQKDGDTFHHDLCYVDRNLEHQTRIEHERFF